MTSQDYGVRVIRAYSNMTVGRVIFPPGVLRDRLVATGFVERVQPPAGGEQSAVIYTEESDSQGQKEDAGKIEFRRRGRG